jgi:hypothetical protein
MPATIPTEAEWRSEPWDMDVSYAYKHFAGKSFEEAVDLFKDNALTYQEDVMFMPRACFPFYVRAYVAYLHSDASKDDADGASCFFGLAEFRTEEIRSDGSLVSEIVNTLRHLATRQEWYDADVDIYGSFAERAQRTEKKLIG